MTCGEKDEAFPLHTGESLKSRPAPAIPGQAATNFVALNTKNSDGSDQHSPRSSTRPTLKWIVVLVASTALAALSVRHGARFFN